MRPQQPGIAYEKNGQSLDAIGVPERCVLTRKIKPREICRKLEKEANPKER